MNSLRHMAQRNVTVWLTFLAQLFCVKPTLQGLTWFECCEISKYELLRQYTLCFKWQSGVSSVWFIMRQWVLICYMSWWLATNIAQITLCVTWRLHCMAIRHLYSPKFGKTI